MGETERKMLGKLRDSGASGLRKSDISKRCLVLVENLRACGAAEFRPSPSGRGVVLAITSDLAFEQFVSARLPAGLDFDATTIQSHADAVHELADAKAFSQSEAEAVLVRSTRPNLVINSTDLANSVPVGELTKQTSCAAIQLSATRQWAFSGKIVIVENADAFWRHDFVFPKSDLAVFSNGIMSGRLIDWLSSHAMLGCEIIHWGDYDPVGVSEYLRLAKVCPGRVKSFVPEGLESSLRKYGKRSLVIEQPQFFDRIRQEVSDVYVQMMVDLFDRHRKGLEQEFLLRQKQSL